MTIGKAVELLDAEVLSGNVDLNKEIETICGSDMMSDVLAFIKKNALLSHRALQSAGDPHRGDAGHYLYCFLSAAKLPRRK